MADQETGMPIIGLPNRAISMQDERVSPNPRYSAAPLRTLERIVLIQ